MTCIAAGVLAGDGRLYWPTALVGCYLGIVLGDGGLWLLGHTLGRRAVELRGIRSIVTPDKLARAEEWFKKYGVLFVLLARLVPGSRFPAYLAAGILGTRARVFILVSLLTALVWSPALIWLSSRFGQQLTAVFGGMEKHPILTLFGSLAVIVTA
ncbi:MAG TPA: VTT domain-containing protein, partial [Planctomycetota bacterium]